jgi:YbbR domain-containing protein
MMSLLRRNWEYKLLSLVLSILLYIIASTQRTPSRTSSMPVLPEVTGIAPDLAIKVAPPSEQVTLTGSADELEIVRKSGLRASVNAAGAKVGKSFLPVTYILPEAVRGRVSVEAPPMLQVELEARTQKKVAVGVLFENQPPPGFEYDAPEPEPTQVMVTGLASDVERVERIVALLNNSGSTGLVSREVPVVAQDDQQQVVSNVTLQPTRVRVSLKLRQRPATKTLVLSANLTGQPSPDVALSGYEFTPSMMVVQGDPVTLSKLTALSVPVDIAGLKQSETRKIALLPPPGVSMVAGKVVQLSLRVALPKVNKQMKKEGQ